MIPYFNITAIEEQRGQSRDSLSKSVFQDDSGYGVVFAYHRHYKGTDVYFLSRDFRSFVPKQYKSKIYCLPPDWRQSHQLLFDGEKQWLHDVYRLGFSGWGPSNDSLRHKLKRKNTYINSLFDIPVYSLLPNEIVEIFEHIVSEYRLPHTEHKVTLADEPYTRDVKLDNVYTAFVYPIDETEHLSRLNEFISLSNFEPKEVKTELLAILVPIRDLDCVRNPNFIPSLATTGKGL